MKIRSVYIASVMYLTLPYFIFLFGWLKVQYSLIGALALVISLYFCFKEKPPLEEFVPHTKVLTVGFSVIFVVMLFSGIGGFGFQNYDWSKHNAISRDLIHFNWPVIYDIVPDHPALVYYMAYYLPPAVIGKMFGWKAANLAFFAWSFIGMSLAFYWFSCLVKKASVWLVLLFIGFSGLDALGYILMNGKMMGGTQQLEWYAGQTLWQYSSIVVGLFWTPQHIIPGLLITAIILTKILEQQRSLYSIGFIAALSAFWSPFVMIGLFPIIIISLYINRLWGSIISIPNIVGSLVLLASSALFYKSGQGADFSHFIWEEIQLTDRWPSLLLFLLCEFWIYIFIIHPYIKKESVQFKSLLYLAASFLSLLPFYKMGFNNDLVMRGSIPCLLIIMVAIGRAISEKETQLNKGILIGALSIGLLTGFTEISRSIQLYGQKWGDTWFSIAAAPEIEGRSQYLGNTNGFFFRKLTKPDSNNSNPLVTSKDLAWSETSSTATVDTRQLSIKSELPVDAAMVTSAMLNPGYYLVKITVTGKLEKSDTAAHFSIHGVRKIINIPSTIGEKTVLYGSFEVEPGSTKTQFSFGLGGWGQGKGEIKLNDVQIYDWN